MKSTADIRKPHSGASRSLVIALDIGTTFSGVSYAILEPGEVPKIHGVTRFPGQEHVAGNSKIPSVMFYDRFGNMKAAGAEAESASILSRAEEEGWSKTELFKLRLRPKTMKLDMNGMRLSPLPRKKTASDVFGDFLSYLFLCTRNFITDTHANGEALWHAVEHDIQFVLSHPNGWEGAQQMKIRKSAIYGGLIPDTDEGKARIRFVTEGEASLHACMLNGLAADVLSDPSNPGFLVVDAGGGTLDISSYAIRGTVPLVIEEIAPPDCMFAGSVFVSHRAREFLTEKLKNSKYGTVDSVDHITKRFDETTKRLFRDRKEPQFIPFGSPLDKDPTVGIRGGQLKLTGDEVAELFEPSVGAAVASIRAQIDASAGVVKSVWLVGGFAASPYLFKQLQERLSPMNVTVSRPDSQTSKAVADGAIGFYCDHHVSARMSKFMYGVEYLREYDERDEEHIARRGRLCELPSGPRLLPDAFDCILARRTKVKESTVFSRKYCTELTNLSSLSVFEVDVWCYRGGDIIPKWILRQGDHFSTLCVVRADLSPLSGSAQPKQGRNGKTYWTIIFSVEIHFGLTEFRARIKWVDNGDTKYGPATIVYNESGHRADEEEPDSAPEDDATPIFPHSQKQASKPSSRVHTPGNVTPSGIKEISAPEHAKSDALFGLPELRNSGIERTTSKTGSSSPYTPHGDTERDGRPQDESGKDKGKDKDIGKTSEKAKQKQKSSKSQSDGIKHGETLTPEWEPPKTPISPEQTAPLKSPNTEPGRKETATETSKEKDKPPKKTTKKNQTSYRTPKESVKTVDFILPTAENFHDPPKSFSPNNNESPLVEPATSHSMKDADALLENSGSTPPDAFLEIEKEKSNVAEGSSSFTGLPNIQSHFEFGGSDNKDAWTDFDTNEFTHQPSSQFMWESGDSTATANPLAPIDGIPFEPAKLADIPEASWMIEAKPFSFSHHSSSTPHVESGNYTEGTHVIPENPTSDPLSLDNILSAVHDGSSTPFFPLETETPAADLPSPLDDKLLQQPAKPTLTSSVELPLSDHPTLPDLQPSSVEQPSELNEPVKPATSVTSPDLQSPSPKPPAEGEIEPTQPSASTAQPSSPKVSPEDLLDLIGGDGAGSGDDAAPEYSQPPGKKKGGQTGGGKGKKSKKGKGK